MRITLPPSLRRELHPIAEEVAEYRDMPPTQKLRILDALCRDAMVQLAMHEDRERLLDWQAPLPGSTVAALRRLHAGLLAHGGR